MNSTRSDNKTYQTVPPNGLRWEITSGRWTMAAGLPTHASIFDVSMDTTGLISMLTFTRQMEADAYGTALAILHYVGWRPSVVYHKALYPRNWKKISWAKIRFEDSKEQDATKNNHQTPTRAIAGPMHLREYAVRTTTKVSGEGRATKWARRLLRNQTALRG